MVQQKWASQYVAWSFNNNNLDVWNIDQKIWIPQPNANSFWVLQWSWRKEKVGGYLGIQQADDGSQQVRFSIWNAIACQNGNCTPFGGEGIGYTCVIPITINTDKFYRLRLWRVGSDSEGIWWQAWLIEDNNGVLTEHNIGKIKVPSSYSVVDPATITNFVEYFGSQMNCKDVPLSIVGFTPPEVNYSGSGTDAYEDYSTYAGSNTSPSNTCGTQQQQYGTGALITARPFNFGFTNGVVMFLGGNNLDPQLNLTIQPTPPNMPSS